MERAINKPFMTLKETCAYTGLSVYQLRNGVKDGSVPHIKTGNKYLVNVPLFLEKLNRESIILGGGLNAGES